MVWYAISGLLFVIASALLIYNFLRDRKFMRLKISEAMSPEIKKELDEELNEARRRQKKFKTLLTEALQKKEQHVQN